jgi:hypothetical protein
MFNVVNLGMKLAPLGTFDFICRRKINSRFATEKMPIATTTSSHRFGIAEIVEQKSQNSLYALYLDSAGAVTQNFIRVINFPITVTKVTS